MIGCKRHPYAYAPLPCILCAAAEQAKTDKTAPPKSHPTRFMKGSPRAAAPAAFDSTPIEAQRHQKLYTRERSFEDRVTQTFEDEVDPSFFE